jgi:hypothetical protein
LSKLVKVLLVCAAVSLAVFGILGFVIYRTFSSGLDSWTAVGPPVESTTVVPEKDVILDVAWGDPRDIGLQGGLYLVDAENGSFLRWTKDVRDVLVHLPAWWSPAAGKVFWSNGSDGLFAVDLGDAPTAIVARGKWRSVSGDGRHGIHDIDGAWTLEAMAGDEPAKPLPDAVARADHSLVEISPASDRVAFVESSGAGTVRVVSVPLDGKEERVLLDGVASVYSIQWSPDASAVAVHAMPKDHPGGSALWVIPLEGEPRLIDLGSPVRSKFDDAISSDARGGIEAVTWSPRSDRLAVLTDRDGPCWSGGQDLGGPGCFASVYLVNADGTGMRRVSKRHQASGTLYWLR